MKCGTRECPHYNEKFIDHCHLGSECQDYTSWKSNRIKELESAMQEFVNNMSYNGLGAYAANINHPDLKLSDLYDRFKELLK